MKKSWREQFTSIKERYVCHMTAAYEIRVHWLDRTDAGLELPSQLSCFVKLKYTQGAKDAKIKTFCKFPFFWSEWYTAQTMSVTIAVHVGLVICSLETLVVDHLLQFVGIRNTYIQDFLKFQGRKISMYVKLCFQNAYSDSEMPMQCALLSGP